MYEKFYLNKYTFWKKMLMQLIDFRAYNQSCTKYTHINRCTKFLKVYNLEYWLVHI